MIPCGVMLERVLKFFKYALKCGICKISVLIKPMTKEVLL